MYRAICVAKLDLVEENNVQNSHRIGSIATPPSVKCHFDVFVVTEVILPHFRVRPFCVVVSSLLWNRSSRVPISEPELTRHSALHFIRSTEKQRSKSEP